MLFLISFTFSTLFFQTHLITLIHHMGGSIRKDISARVTHLIANCCGGEKYRYATVFRVPVVSRSWVDYCWEQRGLTDCRAADDAIVVSGICYNLENVLLLY